MKTDADHVAWHRAAAIYYSEKADAWERANPYKAPEQNPFRNTSNAYKGAAEAIEVVFVVLRAGLT